MTTISVTAEHIAKGQPRSAFSCPVAFAVEDALPGTNCYAGRDHLSLYSRAGLGPPYLRTRHPDSVLKFIRAFDSEQPVEPFTFDLDYPAEAAA